MSYCRWSCLNGYSEVYVYHSSYGSWVTHVAQNRFKGGMPVDDTPLVMDALLPVTEEAKSRLVEFMKQVREAYRGWFAANRGAPINHPEAGTTFTHETPGECAANLRRLAEEGFIVPRHAVLALEEEEKANE